MREINLNGYIDDEVWFGDEITPESLHESLYGANNEYADDVHIRLNSYGGSCNAATRMYDDIRAYPGKVLLTVSGTAASAATVLSMAANKLEMTPGSLWMIHDPSTVAWGNERDLMGAIDLLRACKESILNVYGKRCRKKREDIAAMMTATTWMDAQSALSNGFIDSIVDDEQFGLLANSSQPRSVDLKEAKEKVQAWFDRHKPQLSRPVKNALQKQEVSPAPEASLPTEENPLAEAAPSPGDDHTSAVPPAEQRCASNLRFEPSAVGKADLRIQGFATLEQAMMPVDTGGTAPPAEPEEPSAPEDPIDPQETPAVPEQPDTSGATEQPEEPGIPVAQLRKRLGLIMPAKKRSI